MWIKRNEYVALQRENASLAATIQSTIEASRRYEREIDYWRGKFESAQNRADRVADLAFETSGMRPISDLGVAERDKNAENVAEVAERQRELITEMFADEIPDEIEQEGADDAEGFVIDPELIGALQDAAAEMQGKK